MGICLPKSSGLCSVTRLTPVPNPRFSVVDDALARAISGTPRVILSGIDPTGVPVYFVSWCTGSQDAPGSQTESDPTSSVFSKTTPKSTNSSVGPHADSYLHKPPTSNVFPMTAAGG